MWLVRLVHVDFPIGTSLARRRAAKTRAWMTAGRVLVAIACAPVIVGVLCMQHETSPSRGDLARTLVRMYAYEAFPQWASQHFEEACPRSISELSPMIERDAVDPWGERLELRCGPGIRGAYVRSAGEDGRFETSDDITSND